jgi:hypothetical protein
MSTKIKASVSDLKFLETVKKGDKLKGTATNASKIEFLIDGVPSNNSQSTDVVNGKWDYKLDFKGIKTGNHYLVLKAVDKNGRYSYSKTYYFDLENKIKMGWIIFGLLVLAGIGYKLRDNYLTKKKWMEQYKVEKNKKKRKEDKS